MAAILIVYAAMLSFIALFVIFQFIHWFRYMRTRKINTHVEFSGDYLPFITIQLPIYNEKFVVKRLIDAVLELDYPTEKLEIQILDDSTDECTEIVADYIKNIEVNINIQHIRRKDRIGFKAGALQVGMQQCKGEFIAIFDADFVPNSDFLKRMIPKFQDAEIGMVQARWGHLNRNNSLLTQMQAFGLDAHFTIEQVGRNLGGLFINFNGTAGIWRKSCIEDAGGWSHDTLTEDLDLSYRAQLKGWQFAYMEDVEVPAELPSNIHALKGQQFRWTKGGAECLGKLTPKIIKGEASVWQKINGLIHLGNSFLFIAIFSCALLSIPSLFIKIHSDVYDVFFQWAAVFVSSLLFLSLIYLTAYNKVTGQLKGFWWRFPMFLSVSMGLSLHNAIAVLEGYIGKKSPFVRTPKSGETALDGEKKNFQYINSSVSLITWLEMLLAFVFAAAALYGIVNLEFGLVFFHTMLSVGFFYVANSAFSGIKLRVKNAL